jgi:acyl carrier protein
MTDTQAIITAFLSETSGSQDGLADIDPDASLIKAGILDSLGLLKLMFFIEERFGLKIEDVDVIPANFETIDRITMFIETRVAGTQRVS